MSSLFTLSQSWHCSTWLYEQLAFATDRDAILLLEDATLALQSPVSLASFLAKCANRNINVYALLDDVSLRGVDNQYQSVAMVDYAGFVDLVSQHKKQVAW